MPSPDELLPEINYQVSLPIYRHQFPDGVIGEQAISGDDRYRYWLARTWDSSLPRLCWMMLNPSKASHELNDMTITKCTGFAKRHGAGAIDVVNLFSYRATRPADLFTAWAHGHAALGADTCWEKAFSAERLVLAWGGGACLYRKYVREVLEDVVSERQGRGLEPAMCLGYTRYWDPRHPSRLAYDSLMIPYEPEE